MAESRAEESARLVLEGKTRSHVAAASELALAFLRERAMCRALESRGLQLEAALKRLDPVYDRGILKGDEDQAVPRPDG